MFKRICWLQCDCPVRNITTVDECPKPYLQIQQCPDAMMMVLASLLVVVKQFFDVVNVKKPTLGSTSGQQDVAGKLKQLFLKPVTYRNTKSFLFSPENFFRKQPAPTAKKRYDNFGKVGNLPDPRDSRPRPTTKRKTTGS